MQTPNLSGHFKVHFFPLPDATRGFRVRKKKKKRIIRSHKPDSTQLSPPPFEGSSDNCVPRNPLCLVIQSCLPLCNPMDCSLPGSSVHGDSPGKNAGVGCRGLLQVIFPTQEWNPGLLHCGWILYCLSHQGNPRNPLILGKNGQLGQPTLQAIWSLLQLLSSAREMLQMSGRGYLQIKLYS